MCSGCYENNCVKEPNLTWLCLWRDICLQRYTCVMADDLKGFYMSANGLSIQWKVRMKGELNKQQVMLLLKHSDIPMIPQRSSFNAYMVSLILCDVMWQCPCTAVVPLSIEISFFRHPSCVLHRSLQTFLHSHSFVLVHICTSPIHVQTGPYAEPNYCQSHVLVNTWMLTVKLIYKLSNCSWWP